MDGSSAGSSARIGFNYFAEADPSALALVAPDGRRWTRGDLAVLSNRLAHAFRSAGLMPGDSLAILAPNCAEFVAVFLAGVQAGLSVVPINWHLAEPEVLFVLADSDARLVVVHEDLGSGLLNAVIDDTQLHHRAIVCIGDRPGLQSLAAFAASCPAAPLYGEAGRLMAYTSATTGRPKAVQLPSANAAAALDNILAINKSLGLYPEDGNVHLCASMLYHSAPLGGVHVALQMGHRVVLAGSWTAELLLKLIDEHQVTTTFMVPTMFVQLLKLPADVRARYSTRSLRLVVHGAAPCPQHIKSQMLDWFGDVVWDTYGATEVQGTLASPADCRKYPGTVGRALPGSEVRIFDESGVELPAGHVGLVYMKSHTGDRFRYRNNPQATERAYLGDFICAGDLGYLNEEGYLFLCGRSSELIISSGMNIYPAEIEMVLNQHPAVLDCAVLGVPHELLGEVPKAYVLLAPGYAARPALTAELLRFVGAHLSAMKLPKRIEYVERLPRDPNGKLYKRMLRQPVPTEPQETEE